MAHAGLAAARGPARGEVPRHAGPQGAGHLAPRHVRRRLVPPPGDVLRAVGAERRGPAQGAMTSKELKEFGELWDCDTFVDPEEVILNKASEDELADRNGRAKRKIYELFCDYAQPKKPHKALKRT